MTAVDILEVPVSTRNNSYLLIVQDYFTEWVEAIYYLTQSDGTINFCTVDQVVFYIWST